MWLADGARVVVIAARDPYTLATYRELPCLVTGYCQSLVCLQALAAVLAGRVKSQGRLPVTLA